MPPFLSLLLLLIILAAVYLFQSSSKNRITKRSSTETERSNAGCEEPATNEIVFTSIKKSSVRTNKEFIDKKASTVENIAIDIIFFLSVLANAYFVFICYGILLHCRTYPGGLGFVILAVYFFGFFIWGITIWQIIISSVLFFKSSRKRFFIRLPGLIITVIGFVIFNYNLMLVFSE